MEAAGDAVLHEGSVRGARSGAAGREAGPDADAVLMLDVR